MEKSGRVDSVGSRESVGPQRRHQSLRRSTVDLSFYMNAQPHAVVPGDTAPPDTQVHKNSRDIMAGIGQHSLGSGCSL